MPGAHDGRDPASRERAGGEAQPSARPALARTAASPRSAVANSSVRVLRRYAQSPTVSGHDSAFSSGFSGLPAGNKLLTAGQPSRLPKTRTEDASDSRALGVGARVAGGFCRPG